MNGRNGKRKPAAKKRSVLAKPTKAQLAARARFLRDAERETGIKVSREDVAAVVAELESLGR